MRELRSKICVIGFALLGFATVGLGIYTIRSERAVFTARAPSMSRRPTYVANGQEAIVIGWVEIAFGAPIAILGTLISFGVTGEKP